MIQLRFRDSEPPHAVTIADRSNSALNLFKLYNPLNWLNAIATRLCLVYQAIMSVDYSKKKNAELEDLLKARSLPHTGKKADLIARIVEDDKKHGSSITKLCAPAPNEDEIDWEDDGATATAKSMIPPPATEPGAAAIAAGGQGPVPNPTIVPNQMVAVNPASTSDLTVIKPAEANGDKPIAPKSTADAQKPEDKPTPTDYTAGLSSTSAETELEKRRKRAERFGLKESDEDATKALERAKRFGTGSADDKITVKGLDEALPERVAGRKRGQGDGDGERAQKRRSGERNRSGGNEQKRSRAGERNSSRVKRNGGGGEKRAAIGLSEKDRLAADARKKRFSAAA